MCEAVGADVNDVVLGMGYDKRIGHEFLRPGPGWGGICFPKDSRALVRIAEDAGYDFDLLEGVIAVNDEQFDRVADKVEPHGRRLASRAQVVAVWGLTFKARTDDLRDSPSLADHRAGCSARGATVQAYDPAVNGAAGRAARRHRGRAPTRTPPCDGRRGARVLTEWDEFSGSTSTRSPSSMAAPRDRRRPQPARPRRPHGAAASTTRASAGA